MPEFSLNCPVPTSESFVVQMAHGGGGRMSQRLLENLFLRRLHNPALDERNDASILTVGSSRIAVSTDGFVVRPWRFPGGDIGSLAVHGTVNDLAMAGARASGLTAAFILEEGFSIQDLKEVVDSMGRAADEAGVSVVAGDTKVVERGHGDKVYIVTTGVGEVVSPSHLGPKSICAGDVVLLSGDIGRHGAAVMSVREGLELSTPVISDSAPVHAPALALAESGLKVSCMRDPTRGGLASILNEIARDAGFGIAVDEVAIPVMEDVAGIAELLGLDPLYMACEGRFIAFVAPDQEEAALSILRSFPVSAEAVRIGQVLPDPGEVVMKSRIGVYRVLDLLSGEQLPRIC